MDAFEESYPEEKNPAEIRILKKQKSVGVLAKRKIVPKGYVAVLSFLELSSKLSSAFPLLSSSINALVVLSQRSWSWRSGPLTISVVFSLSRHPLFSLLS